MQLLQAVVIAAWLAIATTHGCTPCTGHKPAPRSTTSGRIALNNLAASIASLSKRFERKPSQELGEKLCELLLQRARFTGSYSDFEAALNVAEQGLQKTPGDPAALRLRAKVRSTLHDFDGALKDLAFASKNQQIKTWDPLKLTIELARGESLPALFKHLEARARQHASFQVLTQLAAVEAALGRYKSADKHYAQALEHYRDVSPFPFAWVAFQRGVMWAEQADMPQRARPFYEEAVRRLPSYVQANVHLAELEAETGDKDDAIQRLQTLVSKTEDPEPLTRLAAWVVDPNAAQKLSAQAAEKYEDLLRRFPNAFLDHASEFYREVGENPQKALELAERNLEMRKNSRAYQLAIEAALAAKKITTACQYARNTLEHSTPSTILDALAKTTLKSCKTPHR